MILALLGVGVFTVGLRFTAVGEAQPSRRPAGAAAESDVAAAAVARERARARDELAQGVSLAASVASHFIGFKQQELEELRRSGARNLSFVAGRLHRTNLSLAALRDELQDELRSMREVRAEMAKLVSTVGRLKDEKDKLSAAATSAAKLAATAATEVNELKGALGVGGGLELRAIRADVNSLKAPWKGYHGEVVCVEKHRCQGYMDAGTVDLAAVTTVETCHHFCNATYPHVPFFAFHSEVGYVAFAKDPKGRCRCYKTNTCELAPDSGYNLWAGDERGCLSVPEP